MLGGYQALQIRLLNGRIFQKLLSKEPDAQYRSEQGKMCIGWKQIKEDWYYFTEEDSANIGKMCTAWKEIRNKWYFFNPVEGKDNGKMLSNTMVDGYTLAVDGAWKTEVQRAG